MREGTNATLVVGDYGYKVGWFKVSDSGRLCGSLELSLDDTVCPDVNSEESYAGRLLVNGDALWYFPWLWFDELGDLPRMRAGTNGAIFCPFGLSDEDEDKYEAINSFVSVEPGEGISHSMWRQMLLVSADWLLDRSIPQGRDFARFAVDGASGILEN